MPNKSLWNGVVVAVVTAILTGLIGYFVMREQMRIEFRDKLQADQKNAFLTLQNTLTAQAKKASQDLETTLTAQAEKASNDLENTLVVENQKFSYEIARDLINLGDDGERLTKAKLYQALGEMLAKHDFAGWLSKEISDWESHGPKVPFGGQTYNAAQRRVVVETQKGTSSLNNEQEQNVNSALLAAGFIRTYNPEDYKHFYGNAGEKVVINYNPEDAALGKIVATIVKQRGNLLRWHLLNRKQI